MYGGERRIERAPETSAVVVKPLTWSSGASRIFSISLCSICGANVQVPRVLAG